MSGNPKQKLKLLRLMQILLRYSDEDHPMNSKILCEKLKEYGINADKKSVYRDINILIEFGLDIIREKGYFIASREFETSEIELLIAAVMSAECISRSKSEKLCKKLKELISVSQAESINLTYTAKGKSDNEELYYNIDRISNAVREKKKIVFELSTSVIEGKTLKKSKEKNIKVSPYTTSWENGIYYLICADKDGVFQHVRIDSMHKVKVISEKIDEICAFSDDGYFDADEYVSKLFRMGTGEYATVLLRCKNFLIDDIFMKFGKDITLIPGGENSFIIKVSGFIGCGFFSWVLSYGDAIEILGPQNIRANMQNIVRTLNDKYSRKPSGYIFL